jgi:hypothetical protein
MLGTYDIVAHHERSCDLAPRKSNNNDAPHIPNIAMPANDKAKTASSSHIGEHSNDVAQPAHRTAPSAVAIASDSHSNAEKSGKSNEAHRKDKGENSKEEPEDEWTAASGPQHKEEQQSRPERESYSQMLMSGRMQTMGRHVRPEIETKKNIWLCDFKCGFSGNSPRVTLCL